MAGIELPEEAKTLTMPVQQCFGVEDLECVFPMLNATGEKDEPEAIGSRETRFIDLAEKNNELLAKQGIFGDQLGLLRRKSVAVASAIE